MFDIGFSELIVIGLVALVVIGPERLPRVTRTVGHLLGRLQRYVSDVKSDIQREMQLEDLKKLQQQVAESARQIESSVRNQVGAVEADIGKTAAAATAALAGDAAIRAPSPGEENAARESPEAALDAHLAQADALAGPTAFAEPGESAPVEASPSPQLELGLELPSPTATDKPA
jgi:sec-independent protein translocase protein TatB